MLKKQSQLAGDTRYVNRRKLIRFFGAAASVAAAPIARSQAAFPAKTIRILVASQPGAMVDKVSRLYADRMSAFLKQPIVVENLAGASSLLAARQLFKAAADGYTLMTSANTMVTVSLINRNAGYTVADFTAVGELARSPQLLVVASASPYQSLPELIQAAKRNPEHISYGSGGFGTTGHLPVEMFASQARIKLTHVPYKGGAAAITDVAGGRVTFMMGTPTSAAELIKGGTLRALATSSDVRSPKFPGVPTFRELGYPEGTYELWVGLVGPKGIPAPVRARLAQAMDVARSDAELLANLEGAGQEISANRTPEQFESVLRTEEAKVRKIMKDAGIVPE